MLIRLPRRWSIQAFCRTANAFLYTTAGGVTSLPSTPASMPSDYAAFAYDMMPNVGAFFVGTDMASSIQQQRHLSFINSVYQYTVTASSTVSLFLDVNQVVSCYDGTMTAPVPGSQLGNSSSSGLIYPMGANMTYGSNGNIDRTVIFDWSAPQFGFSSWTLPVFVGVGEGGDASAVGETYAFATSLADLPRPGAAPVDWSRVVVGTLTWSDAGAGGQLMDMRVRGSSMGFPAQFGVMGGFFDFAPASGNTWTFHNGQQKYWDYHYLAERTFSGFVRTTDFSTTGAMAVGDGPECGVDPCSFNQGPTPDGSTCHSMPNSCTHGSVTFYYIQLNRST